MTKPKKCRICKASYIPLRTLQPTCQKFECQVAFAERVATKAASQRDKATRASIRQRAIELKPLQYWLKRTERAVNAFIRARDKAAGHGCITCGTYDAEEWHAGHWISVGASSALRYDPSNIHLQCRQCNYYGAGRAQDYEMRLPGRIGQAEYERLKYAPRDRKWTREELRDIEARFKSMLSDLNHSRR